MAGGRAALGALALEGFEPRTRSHLTRVTLRPSPDLNAGRSEHTKELFCQRSALFRNTSSHEPRIDDIRHRLRHWSFGKK
jgi:hypothetical protein